nr:N-acetylglucosamine-6-phosphate deacetylase [Clostridia bacterium]
MKRTLFKNFKVLKNGQLLDGASVLVENDKIIGVGNIDEAEGAEVICGCGCKYLSAGFIDIHVHGGGGYDFMDADPDEYAAIAKHHAKFGCTALYPTTLSASHEELVATVNAFAKAKNVKGGAKLLGMHMEGPYIAMSMKGAMDPKYIRDPKPEEYEELCAMSPDIKRITLAPELPGAAELCKYLVDRGIVPSIGHTDSTAADVIHAHVNGKCCLMTHLYSAMSMTHRRGVFRHAGAVEAAYMLDDMYVEIITDGIHLPKELLQLIYKLKGSDKIALITDAMRGSGMPDGVSILGSRKNGQEVLLEDGVAKLMDKSAFAGSIATCDRLARTMTGLAGVSIEETVKMMSEIPAKIMGIENERGSLDAGKYADIVVFGDNVDIELTMVEGDVVYKK